MKASNVSTSLKSCIEIKQPVFLWGPPGIGKSQVVAQTADKLGYEIRDIRAVLLDPVDLRGLPSINGDNYAHWCQPDFLPKTGKGVLFLDELNAAPPLVQAACYQLVLDRKLGEYVMPKEWAVIAAGNRETDKAVTHRMPSPLANRFVHIYFDVDLEDWVTWALNHDILIEIISFLRYRSALLHDFDPSRNEKAFPSPRSWEFVSNIMKTNPSQEIEYELLKGTVGEGAAAEFVGFLRIFRKLPNPDTVLMNPDKTEIPDDPATLYALCGSLARKATADNIEDIVIYAKRLAAEFSVLLIRDCIKRNKNLQSTRAYVEWTSAHQNVLI